MNAQGDATSELHPTKGLSVYLTVSRARVGWCALYRTNAHAESSLLTEQRSSNKAVALAKQSADKLKRTPQSGVSRFVAAGSGCCGLEAVCLVAPVRTSLCAARLSAAFACCPACLCCQVFVQSRRACVARRTLVVSSTVSV